MASVPARLRPSPRAFRVLSLTVVVATVVVMVSGSLVRLTESGLGCSDWPACEQDQFVAAWDQPHAVMEFVNRMLSGVLGVPILLVLGAALVRRPFRRDLFGWSLGLFGGMAVEAVLGAFVVKFGLTPPMVIAHFLVAVAMLWNALVLHERAGQPDPAGSVARVPLVAPRAQALGWAAAIACGAAIAVGTVVTGAGPHGGDTRADRLPFSITAVARIHSIAAWIALGLVVATLAVLYRTGAPASVRRRAAWTTGALVAQGAIGYLQYATGIPRPLVGIHVLGSTLVWIATVRLVLGCTGVPAAADAGRAEPRLAAA